MKKVMSKFGANALSKNEMKFLVGGNMPGGGGGGECGGCSESQCSGGCHIGEQSGSCGWTAAGVNKCTCGVTGG